MKTVKRLLVASIVLGVLSLASFIFERLALTDIFHGEPDPRLEWRIVSASLLPILAFHALALVAALVAVRYLVRTGAGE